MADLTKYAVLQGGPQDSWTPIGVVTAPTREKALELALPEDNEGGGEYRVVPESAWGEVYVPDVKVERSVTVKTKAKPKPTAVRDASSGGQLADSRRTQKEPAHAA